MRSSREHDQLQSPINRARARILPVWNYLQYYDRNGEPRGLFWIGNLKLAYVECDVVKTTNYATVVEVSTPTWRDPNRLHRYALSADEWELVKSVDWDQLSSSSYQQSVDNQSESHPSLALYFHLGIYPVSQQREE